MCMRRRKNAPRVCAYESVYMLLQSFLRSNAYNMETEKTHAVRLLRWCFISNRRPDFFLWKNGLILVHFDVRRCYGCATWSSFYRNGWIYHPSVSAQTGWLSAFFALPQVNITVTLLPHDTHPGCATWSSFYRNGWIYHPSVSAQTRMIISFLWHWPQVKHHSNSSTSWYTPQQRLESKWTRKVLFDIFFLKNWNVKAFATHEPK